MSRHPAPSTAFLDVRSRQSVREFAVQATVGLTLLLAISILHVRSLSEIGEIAVRVFTFYSIIECVRALFGREVIGSASLTRWDQAAAYALCAMFFDLLLTWPSRAG